MKEVQELINKGSLEAALAIVNRQLVTDEYSIELLSYKAKLNRTLEKYESALEAYGTLINLVPNNADLHAGRGLTLHASGQRSPALADFDTAVELEPSNGYRYASRAFIKDFYGDHQGAIDDYTKALEFDPDDAVSLNNLGIVQEKIGRLEMARKSFDEADKITGVEHQINEIRSPSSNNGVSKADDHSKSPSNQQFSIKHYWQTLRSIVLSKKERQAFFRFIKIRK